MTARFDPSHYRLTRRGKILMATATVMLMFAAFCAGLACSVVLVRG